MNKLLTRQVEKFLGGKEQIPKELKSLFFAISGTYDGFDNDRELCERSIEISSEELLGANNKLKKSEKKFKTYIDLAGVIMLAIDCNGIITYINKKGCKMLKSEEKQIVGKNWFDNFLPKRSRKEPKDYSKKLLCKEAGYPDYHENKVLTKKGEERLIAWHNILIKDENGKIIGHLSSGNDITEKKKAEEKLKQKIEELESFYKIATGREMKMIELKEKIIKLEKKLEKCRNK